MSDMLRPADIAALVETALNAKAIALYDATTVDDKIVFNVTADFQLYERMQKAEYEVGDYQKFTPVIIARIDHYEYPADYLRYEEKYSIGMYGYSDQLISLERIIKAYVVDENTTNKSVVVSPFRITKETADVSFDLDIEPSDGSLDKRVMGAGSFAWTFLDGIMTSYDIIIKIDNEEMPYISYDFADEPSTIQTQTIDTSGHTANIVGTSFYEIQLVLPYISTSTVIKALYKEFYEGSYNKKHVLTYYDTALNETFTYNVVSTSRRFADIRPKVLDFAISLRRIYPTVTVTIDTVSVPVVDFSFNAGAELSTTTGINDEDAENAFLGNSYQINMQLDISDTSNTKTQELLLAILQQNFETPHTIAFVKGTISESYDVLFKGGTYQWQNNPTDKIGVTFVKIDSDV